MDHKDSNRFKAELLGYDTLVFSAQKNACITMKLVSWEDIVKLQLLSVQAKHEFDSLSSVITTAEFVSSLTPACHNKARQKMRFYLLA